MRTKIPFVGLGLAYRHELDGLLKLHANIIQLIEIMPEHFLDCGPIKFKYLEELNGKFTILLHGLNLSIGSVSKPQKNYIRSVIKIIKSTHPLIFSDHLAITRLGEVHVPNLVPTLYTYESRKLISNKIKSYQKIFKIDLAFENITKEFDFSGSTIEEATFFNDLFNDTGCFMLLDLTNLFVNSLNLKFDPYDYLHRINLDKLAYVHLAGVERENEVYIDSHSRPVPKPVWNLFEYLMKLRDGPVNTILERDSRFDDKSEILRDLLKAKSIISRFE